MTQPDDLTRLAGWLADQQATVAARMAQLVATMRAAQPGIRARSYDSPPISGTRPHAYPPDMLERDEVGQDMRRLRQALVAQRRQLDVALFLASKYLDPPAPPRPQDRGLSKCANAFGCPDDAWAEPGRAGRCYACWRHRRAQAVDRRAVTNDQPHALP
ncbi:MAG: hypothetical protein IPM45_18240 [Acidimicrobiales bacterium]|nr:hypothetical protein [Acidimicrobiales bacterium]